MAAGILIGGSGSAISLRKYMKWLSLETGSAEILATAAIASLLPQSLLGFFVGVSIDRWAVSYTHLITELSSDI